MESPIVRGVSASRGYAVSRTLIISALGPITTLGGFVWAIVQPYRITLLHPHGQGFWWLFVEPPLLVMIVGLIFARVVARPLIADLESSTPGDHSGAP